MAEDIDRSIAKSSATFASGSDGAILIDRTLGDLAREADCHAAQPRQWDPRLAELSSPVTTRIPRVVEERCSTARHSMNCGLLASVQYAWASADSLLHLWDYRQESPSVLVVPGDSPIISVAVCPPRAGVFETNVHLLLVLCTRLTVTLFGLQFEQRHDFLGSIGAVTTAPAVASSGGMFSTASSGQQGAPLGIPVNVQVGGQLSDSSAAPRFVHGAVPAVPAAAGAGPSFAPGGMSAAPVAPRGAGQQNQQPLQPRRGDGVQLVRLEGYSVRTDGALFHTVRCTEDGHIMLACDAPQVYELAYSRRTNWIPLPFHSKCRLVRHWRPFAGIRRFLSAAVFAAGRIRVLECAQHDYVMVVDDAGCIRLNTLVHRAVHRFESVSLLEEVAALTIHQLARQVQDIANVHLLSRTVTHVFPVLGLDGHLRAHIVTAAGERLLFRCTADSADFFQGVDTGVTERGPPLYDTRCFYGFKLLQGPGRTYDSARLGSTGGDATHQLRMFGSSTGSALEDGRQPCLCAAGVVLEAVRTSDASVLMFDLHVLVRMDPSGISPEASDLHHKMRFDAPVLDIVEERYFSPGRERLPELPPAGEPSSFRGPRCFAVLFPDAVRVFHLSFKVQSLHRQPATAAECCQHFVQLALPPFDPVTSAGSALLWAWSFDDARAPSFEEQQRYLSWAATLPPVHLGRWFDGLLQFLALVLRPVWGVPLVTTIHGKQFLLDRSKRFELPLGYQTTGYCLRHSEGAVQRTLARLRPAVHFAQQALAKMPHTRRSDSGSSASAAHRSRLFARERKAESEGLALVQHRLREVVEAADRAQQVLAFLRVLHAQKSDYRILQSSVLRGPMLKDLLHTPFCALVSTPQTLAPVAMLCTAFIIESGLTTPAAELVVDSTTFQHRAIDGVTLSGGSGQARDVCRELERQCPGIFALVDLDQCFTRARVEGAAVAAATTGDLLSRCVQCVSSSSAEERWEVLTQSIRAMALEDMRGAAEICIDKVQQLQSNNELRSGIESAALGRAKVLFDALLSALSPFPEEQSCALVEFLLNKTVALRFDITPKAADSFLPTSKATTSSASTADPAPAVPPVHGIILDHLLANKRLHCVLEILLDKYVTDIEIFLKSRCDKNRAAGEVLWKYHLRHGRFSAASSVLQRLAEWPSQDCSLQDRVQYLDLARQAAHRALPQSKDMLDKLSLLRDIAIRVQVPLHQELRLIASDGRVAAKWQRLAAQRAEQLQQLCTLQALYQIAKDFGLFHIVLVVSDLSSSTQEQEITSANWINTFFPPTFMPYAPSEMRALPAMQPHGIFPLLLVRRCATFFAQGESASMLPEVGEVCTEDFRLRASRLLQELATVLKVPGTTWDVRIIATLLEYCNCLWLKSVEADDAAPPLAPPLPPPAEPPTASADEAASSADAAPSAARPPGREAEQTPDRHRSSRAFVALQILSQQPFNLGPENVVKLYVDMLAHLTAWLRDLQALMPADPTGYRPAVGEDDVYMHLSMVIVFFLSDWLLQVEQSGDRTLAAANFKLAWPAARSLLAGIQSRLSDEILQRSHRHARRLLEDAGRLEERGQRI